MKFNWKDYFELAKYFKSQNYLQTENLEEAAKRSLVSRAYYAAFKASINLFSQLGFKPVNSDGDHTAIREFLRRKSIPAFNEISNKLDTLRKDRNSCDYENIILGNIDLMVKNALESTEFVFNKIKEIENMMNQEKNK